MCVCVCVCVCAYSPILTYFNHSTKDTRQNIFLITVRTPKTSVSFKH